MGSESFESVESPEAGAGERQGICTMDPAPGGAVGSAGRDTRTRAGIRASAQDIDIAQVRRAVLQLSGPALAEMLLITLVGMADLIMVGRLGPAAIAAVGLSNQPMLFASGAFMALNVGTTALVARFIGAGRTDAANAVTRQSLILTIIAGFVFSVIGWFFSGWVIRMMGAEADVMPLGTSYLRIVAGGGLFMVLPMSLFSALRGAGDTRTPMAINVACNLLNIMGNYILIYGKLGLPAMGVAGAALSTTLSRVIASAMGFYVVIHGRSHSPIRLSMRDSYRLDSKIIRRILKIGIPATIEQLILRGGQLVYARIVSGFGTTIFAAHQIGMNILGLSFTPGQAFAIASTTLVGQGLGAGKPDLAEKSAMETRRLGMLVSGFMALAFILFGRQLAWLYSNDPNVINKSATVLKIVGLVQPAQSTQFILAGGLRGAGDTKFPLYVTLIGIWGVRVTLAYILGVLLGWGLVGVWMGTAVDQLVRSVLIYRRFSGGAWKGTRI
ncbi:MAG TPA: MATE family efflux transporter [Firmicutes bacterium]|nr:MATE family efflux transporter [Bacillota bacterium]